MIKTIKSIRKNVKRNYRDAKFHKARKELNNKNFTIISNNCWGGNVYRDLGVEYQSPFVGMYIFGKEYIKLLKDFDYYMKQDLVIVEKSRYDEVNNRVENKGYHPVGLLGDVEIALLHYHSGEEALEKWNRRKARMNHDNLFFKISEQFHGTPVLEEFDKLDLPRKIELTSKKYPGLKNAVNLGDSSVDTEMHKYQKRFDIVKWLNEGKIEQY